MQFLNVQSTLSYVILKAWTMILIKSFFNIHAGHQPAETVETDAAPKSERCKNSKRKYNL